MKASEQSTPAVRGDRSIRLIVAEDDADMSFVLEFLLRREGYEVELLRDGREAVARITSGLPVDLIVLDIMMPFVSGLQILRTVRTTPGWEVVPVVIVSGKSSEADVVAAIQAGANDYLTKPFRPKELVARIRGLLVRHLAGRQVA